MEPYRVAVPATIAQYGGRFLSRGGATELIEGGPEPKRIVILEFAAPSRRSPARKPAFLSLGDAWDGHDHGAGRLMLTVLGGLTESSAT
jgi:hypothetical protein